MKKITRFIKLLFFVVLLSVSQTIAATTFVHPGGIHTMADLNRMKTKVASNAHPWIDGWNSMISNSKSQNNYTPHPRTNIGGSGNRQPAADDAHAAYYNTIRWYITGDTTYAECAVRILNAWSYTLTDASGELFQLPINNMMQAAEILRIYPHWAQPDIDKFKSVALNIFYPSCSGFLAQCSRPTSWDAPALSAMMIIAVFCDDQVKYDQAASYYKTGGGNGSLTHAVLNADGQVLEMGRDMVHANIGLSNLAEMCQTAWNQSDTTLYSYASNRLLAGYEYYCKYNLNHMVNWPSVNDCDGDNFLGISYYNARGYLSNNPTFEMAYNHYGVLKGLSTPYTKAMAELARPEGSNADFFGYGTLTCTLDAAASPYPPFSSAPPAPTNLTATPAIGKIYLQWTAAAADVADGYDVLRATSAGGTYTTISSSYNNTLTTCTDWGTPGITYFYKVSAHNQTGASGYSNVASATPVAASSTLKTGWATKDIGSAINAGTATYAPVIENTFKVNGIGNIFGSTTADNFTFTYTSVTGDFTFTTHFAEETCNWTGDRAGIVIRESLDPGAKAVMIWLGDVGNRYTIFQTRSSTGANTNWIGGNKFSANPWYRFVRAGNVFYAYQSTDGVNYGLISSSSLTMNSSCYAGFGVSSGNSYLFTPTTFENVSIIGGGSVPLAPTGFTGTALSSSRMNLSWNPSAATSTYTLIRSTVSGGPYTIIAASITGTAFEDGGLTPGTNYYYVLKSANATGESADSAKIIVATNVLALPPAPSGLTASSGNSRIALSWNVPDEFPTSYNIKRSTVSGGPFTTIGTSIPTSNEPPSFVNEWSSAAIGTSTCTNYTDNTVKNDSVYYYVVSAVNSIGTGSNSSQVGIMPNIGQYAYWPFDETTGTSANDIWTSRKATLDTGATWATGKYNNGLHFDGTANGYASLPSGVVSSLTDFTISMWMKLDAVESWARAFDFGSGTTNYMFITPKSGNTGSLCFSIVTGGSEQQINTTTVMPAGVWTHVAVTLSGGVGILYVNGVEVGRNSAMTLNPSCLGITTQNYIGKSQFADPYLKGTIDEFRIYNQALTPAQITQLKNNTLTQTTATLNLTHQWTFDDGTANDAVLTNPVNGTLTGGATIANKALKLSAEGNYLAFSPTALALNTYSELSLEAWVTTTSTQMLCYFGNGNGLSGSVGSNGFFVTTGSRTAISCVNTTQPWVTEDNVNGLVCNNEMLHHLVSVLSATDITFYVDGILAGTTPLRSGNGISHLGTALAAIGKCGYPNPTWQGVVNKFSIYNKALTASDVLDLYHHGAETDPALTVSDKSYTFEGVNNTDSFTVSGFNLTNPVTLTAPSGITLSTYSIPANQVRVPVTVTSNGTAADGKILVTSGAITDTIAVKAYSSACFTEYAPVGSNLIPNQYLNSFTGFSSNWGNVSIVTGSEAYCGMSCAKISGTGDCYPNGGSISIPVTWKPNTTYRERAMVKTVDGTFAIGHGKTYTINSDVSGKFVVAIPKTTNTWLQIDTTFTTGALASTDNVYFANCDATGTHGKVAYIDNWELYEEPTISVTGNWSVASNWSTGVLPSTYSNVTVKSGTITIDQDVNVHSLTVNPGAKVTLNPGKRLSATTLNLKSDSTGIATFVDNGTTNLIIANVQQYLTSGRNWYISSPVNSATTAALNTATSVVSYNEPTAGWIPENSILTPMKGYVSVGTNSNSAVTFSGFLNTGDQSIILPRTVGQIKEGFNLVGNPYSSYVNWNAATKTNLLTTMWYRTKSASTYVFDTYNSTGNIGTSLGTTTVTNLIPPMQAFWVRVAAGQTSGTLLFTNAMRSHADVSTNSLKAPAVAKETQPVLHLLVSNGTNNDEAVIYFNANASNAYDDFDSPKMSNANVTIPEIFTLAGMEKVAINGLNRVMPGEELSLGFTTGQSNSFTIKASQISNFDAGIQVILRDNLLNTERDLTSGTAYDFTSDIANTSSRFNIVFRSASAITGNNLIGKDKPLVSIFKTANDQIVINKNTTIGEEGIVTVCNVLGQKLVIIPTTGINTLIKKSFSPGIYFVTVHILGRNETQRIIIKN